MPSPRTKALLTQVVLPAMLMAGLCAALLVPGCGDPVAPRPAIPQVVEHIASDPGGNWVRRVRVDGGWLYYYSRGGICFGPATEAVEAAPGEGK